MPKILRIFLAIILSFVAFLSVRTLANDYFHKDVFFGLPKDNSVFILSPILREFGESCHAIYLDENKNSFPLKILVDSEKYKDIDSYDFPILKIVTLNDTLYGNESINALENNTKLIYQELKDLNNIQNFLSQKDINNLNDEYSIRALFTLVPNDKLQNIIDNGGLVKFHLGIKNINPQEENYLLFMNNPNSGVLVNYKEQRKNLVIHNQTLFEIDTNIFGTLIIISKMI